MDAGSRQPAHQAFKTSRWCFDKSLGVLAKVLATIAPEPEKLVWRCGTDPGVSSPIHKQDGDAPWPMSS
jgi:hypothetical protein